MASSTRSCRPPIRNLPDCDLSEFLDFPTGLAPWPAEKQRFAGGKKLEISNHLLEQVESFANLLPFVFGQRAHGIGERLDTALAALPHQADPFGRGFQTDAAAVFGGVAAHQAGALESGDDAAHRGRANLFRVSEFAKRPWSAEDEDGKRGELGRADAAFPVAGAQPAQQV